MGVFLLVGFPWFWTGSPSSGFILFTAQLDVRLEAWNSRVGIFGLEDYEFWVLWKSCAVVLNLSTVVLFLRWRNGI